MAPLNEEIVRVLFKIFIATIFEVGAEATTKHVKIIIATYHKRRADHAVASD